MQNLVVFMEPTENAWQTPLKGGNMFLNRFCIDEDAAFELSGVNDLKKSSLEMQLEREFKAERKEKGKDYSFLQFKTILLQFDKFYLHD